MRKLLLLLIAVLVGSAVASAESDKWMNGDANLDGKIDVTDLTFLMNDILGVEGDTWNMYWDASWVAKNEKDTKSYPFGDLNYDGNIDVSDITVMLEMILGTRTPDTVWEIEDWKYYKVNGVEFAMAYMHGGSFLMGWQDGEVGFNVEYEKPAHKVTLDGYYIGQTEVTQALWVAVMGTGSTTQSKWTEKYGVGDNYPVYMCTWTACCNFIKKLNELTGENFRLPTEAEWEYAARGGDRSQGYKYSGSNTIGDVAWYEKNAMGPHEVGQKKFNEKGLYDMSGNVSEWVNDWFDNYSSEDQVNPTGPAQLTTGTWTGWKVHRGGSYYNDQFTNRVSFRKGLDYTTRATNVGFRLAK